MSPYHPPLAGGHTGEPSAGCDVRRALDAMAVRSQSVGVLMVELDVDADAAYAWLSERARDTGLPVEVVARQLVAPVGQPAEPDPSGPSGM